MKPQIDISLSGILEALALKQLESEEELGNDGEPIVDNEILYDACEDKREHDGNDDATDQAQSRDSWLGQEETKYFDSFAE